MIASKRIPMRARKELHPTSLVREALAAQVLDFMHRGKLGLLELAAAADVVAADCRYNDWVASEVKKAELTDPQWMRLLESGEVVHDRCRAAMAAFDAGGSHEALRSELTAVAAFLNDHTL
jgi:hypothetical protein